MRHLIKKIHTKLTCGIIFLYVTITTILTCAPAFAQQKGGLGDMATKLRGNISQFGGLIQTGAFVLGIGCAVMGIMEFKGAGQKPDCTVKGGAIKLLVGVLLLGLGGFLSTMSETLGGGANTQEGFDAITSGS